MYNDPDFLKNSTGRKLVNAFPAIACLIVLGMAVIVAYSLL